MSIRTMPAKYYKSVLKAQEVPLVNLPQEDYKSLSFSFPSQYCTMYFPFNDPAAQHILQGLLQQSRLQAHLTHTEAAFAARQCGVCVTVNVEWVCFLPAGTSKLKIQQMEHSPLQDHRWLAWCRRCEVTLLQGNLEDFQFPWRTPPLPHPPQHPNPLHHLHPGPPHPPVLFPAKDYKFKS